MTTTTIPAVGDRIIVRCANGLIDTKYIGTEQRVTDVGEGTYYLPGDGIRTGHGTKVYFYDDGVTYYTTEWDIVEPLCDTVSQPERQVGADNITIPANPTMDELVAIIERCSNDLAEQKRRATRAEERLEEQKSHYRYDMNLVEQTMMRVKDEQGWCDDGWNETIDYVNPSLKGGWQFDRMEQEYEVTISVTGTITTTTTVTVTASSEDEARELVNDGDYFDADDVLTDAARNISFDNIDWDVEDISS